MKGHYFVHFSYVFLDSILSVGSSASSSVHCFVTSIMYKSWRTKGLFQFEIIMNVFLIHLNTYVMGLRPL